jgi:hypothetical protein
MGMIFAFLQTLISYIVSKKLCFSHEPGNRFWAAYLTHTDQNYCWLTRLLTLTVETKALQTDTKMTSKLVLGFNYSFFFLKYMFHLLVLLRSRDIYTTFFWLLLGNFDLTKFTSIHIILLNLRILINFGWIYEFVWWILAWPTGISGNMIFQVPAIFFPTVK